LAIIAIKATESLGVEEILFAKDTKKVVYFQFAILGQVGAMHCIPNFI
jgi:hypothetical protein